MIPLRSVVVTLFPDDKTYWRARKSKYLTQLVFQIPLIGKMEKLRIIAEDNKSRRFYARFGHIIDFQPSSLVGRRLHSCHRIG